MRALILFILLMASSHATDLPTADQNGRVCAPFRGGIVDPAIVNTMLQANKEGRLYRIKAKSSEVGFCVNSTIGRVEARLESIQGGLALDKEVWGDQSQVLVMVDTNSLAVEQDFIKNLLKSEHFLDTETYAKILFVSTKLIWLDSKSAVLKGKLSMHGVTKPVNFYITMATRPNKSQQNIDDIIVTAKSFIKRSDFNMNKLTFLVDDEVELCMRIEASIQKKQQPQ